MLEVKNATKRYRTIPAVQNVSFVLAEGEVLGYLGPNGSGKSTTVKMITGMIEPSDGEILFRGHNIHEDLSAFRAHLDAHLPEYARPLFLRIRGELDVTGANGSGSVAPGATRTLAVCS